MSLINPAERNEIFAYAAEPRSHSLGTTAVNGVFASTGATALTQVDLTNFDDVIGSSYNFTTKAWDHSRQFNESAAENSYYWNIMAQKMGLDPWYDRTQM